MIYLTLCTKILAVLFIIQSLEYIISYKKVALTGLGLWEPVKNELQLTRSRYSVFLNYIFKNDFFIIWQMLQFILACILLYEVHLYILFILFIIQFTTLIRFRGLFNGGSDSMAVVVLISIIIAYLNPEKLGHWILSFIAFQSLLSYFRAGFVKLKNKNWRSGHALIKILNASNYEKHPLCLWFVKHSRAAQFISFSLIIFEMAFPFSVFHTLTLSVFLILGFLFHLTNAYFFGLNRFIWAWLSTYPALYYVSIHFK